MHWCILKDKGTKVTSKWINRVPEDTVTKDDVIIMRDIPIITDKKVKSNRPDITIHYILNRTCSFIDIALLVCMNVVRKEVEKIVKYRDLEIETKKYWNLSNVRTIPVVIGALGTVYGGITEYIKTISPKIDFRVLQKTALLGTAHILRNFLTKDEKIGQNKSPVPILMEI